MIEVNLAILLFINGIGFGVVAYDMSVRSKKYRKRTELETHLLEKFEENIKNQESILLQHAEINDRIARLESIYIAKTQRHT